MSWDKIKLGQFLKARESRFKPNDPAISGLKRIEKIDFSGKIYLADKDSKTDMIIVKKGDLVISGINVTKGALAVYEGAEDVTATIHYSSYIYNKKKLDIEYLKIFLKSKIFIDNLKSQIKGGIKTEIKPKHLLYLEVVFPDITVQRKIVEKFKSFETRFLLLKSEIDHQKSTILRLRQSILQDAIQGRLTAEWRRQNPSIEPAGDFLKRIKAEKEKLIKEGKLKKEKPLPPIKPEEIPFEIPEGWVWCRLGEVGFITGGGTPSMAKKEFWNGDILWVTPKDMGEEFLKDSQIKITEKGLQNSSAKMIPEGSLIIVGRSGILKRTIPIAINKTRCTVNQDMKVLIPVLRQMNRFFQFMFFGMESIILKNYVKYGMTVHSLKYTEFAGMPIPMPPIEEQLIIVSKVELLTPNLYNLDHQIAQTQSDSERLLGVVMGEGVGKLG